MIKKLTKIKEEEIHDPNKVLDQATERNWQGLFTTDETKIDLFEDYKFPFEREEGELSTKEKPLWAMI